jgi:hypothetical protein
MSDKNIHTCHADCPCQTGGEPVSDFVEARTQPETGQPIPDEAVEAAWHVLLTQHDPFILRPEAARVIRAALPHIESAKDKRIGELEVECAKYKAFAEWPPLKDDERAKYEARIKELEGRLAAHRASRANNAAAIRADERAKVRERVEAKRAASRLTGIALARYSFAIHDALTAIDEGEQ